MTCHLRPRTGRSPCPLKICRLMIGTIDQWRLLRQAAVSSIPSRRNLFLLLAAPLSACPPPKTAGMHTEPRQNQSELAPAEVHPLRTSAPHPLKIYDKKMSVNLAPARLAWIRTSHPRIALTRRRMTNGIPSDLRQTGVLLQPVILRMVKKRDRIMIHTSLRKRSLLGRAAPADLVVRARELRARRIRKPRV
jgi:hypothetical protein